MRRVEEARREEHVIVAKMQHVGAREAAAEALSDAALLGLDKHQRVVAECGRGGQDGLFAGLCPLALVGLEGVLEVPRGDEEDAEVQKICESRGDGTRHWRDGCLTHEKGVWPGNVPMVKSARSRRREWSETSEPSVNWSSKSS